MNADMCKFESWQKDESRALESLQKT